MHVSTNIDTSPERLLASLRARLLSENLVSQGQWSSTWQFIPSSLGYWYRAVHDLKHDR